ncbi:PREDICTED: probable N-acetyltransferase HLS1 [Erythranthe guttata]|uniref:probable N-acetyltransferase HLS1 n=1 Tax=Erythranthe guttata TaxID=4155 RepID=UPI00064DD3A0|nr:PREDICTED: probable N-acetyltransferase HLS1 [Erythranthe guttata]|eukprot:XP_012832756.1 PREDICTED: probable N-acetyltransferase HLS1 [Erythranthe guttata]
MVLHKLCWYIYLIRPSPHIKLGAADAEAPYRRRFSATEFFPRDIDAVLKNKLNLGTFLAVPKGSPYGGAAGSWPGADEFLASQPESWAVLSVWNSEDVYTLEVRGASRVRRALARTTRAVDRALPWLRLPSVPEVFRPFGFHFLYGIGGEGPNAARMVRSLCAIHDSQCSLLLSSKSSTVVIAGLSV